MRAVHLLPIATTLLLSACASKSPYSRTHSFGERYEHYRPSLVELARLRGGDTPFDYEISDLDVMNFADHVKNILRAKFTNARFARYTSATTQVLLGGLAGAAAAFEAGATTVTTLALSSAAVPQLGGIFNAKGRAETYQDAVRLIEEAELDFLTEVGTPSSGVLTDSGVDLYRRVTTTIHVVEKAIVGQLPTVDEMKAATGDLSRTESRLRPKGRPIRSLRRASAGSPIRSASTTRPTQAPVRVTSRKIAEKRESSPAAESEKAAPVADALPPTPDGVRSQPETPPLKDAASRAPKPRDDAAIKTGTKSLD